MSDFILWLENLISGILPFIFLIFCGIYLTLKSRFFQFRYLPSSVKYALGGIFSKNKSTDGVSPFQSACTALSATVGTGNIAGVAGAISLGGAGAVFWMWLSAALGMCVKVTEILLALKYREKAGGEYRGGPMYYIKNGLSSAFAPLGFLFAFAGVFAVFCSGNLTQTNASVTSVSDNFYIKLTVGIIFAAVTAFVIIGGSKRIGMFTEKIVPVMAAVYIVLSLGILIINIDFLKEAFIMIIKGAFNPSAVTGGLIGSVSATVMTGAARGVFSNEAGLGTSAMAHAAAENEEGVKQSLYGIFEVFADTIVICTLTALTILCSRVNINYGETASTELVQSAFSTLYGGWSFWLLGLMMCLFGISSVIGWGFYGVVCSGFAFGKAGKKLFTAIYPLVCIAGAVCRVDTAWRLSAFFNGIMLCINIAAVMLLSGEAAADMKNFRLETGKKGKLNDKRTDFAPAVKFEQRGSGAYNIRGE